MVIIKTYQAALMVDKMKQRPAIALLLGASFLLAACGDNPTYSALNNQLEKQPDRASYMVRTNKQPKAVVAAFTEAGFENVRLLSDGKTIRVKSGSPEMVDCGQIRQVARGIRTSFPGNTPTAATLDDSKSDQILWRNFKNDSLMTLTKVGKNAYRVKEAHDVELSYRWSSKPNGWKHDATFGAHNSRELDEKTTCRSGRVAQRLL